MRTIKDWKEEKVADIEVAPHRYLFHAIEHEDAHGPDWRKHLPYKEGEVIWIKTGTEVVRAKIYRILYGRNQFGDIMPTYRVQKETAKGVFSKVWVNTWPGMIQRGYKMKGLAPDIPD